MDDGALHPATSKAHSSEALLRLCANTDPQRDSIFTKGPSDVLGHATSEIASGSKPGIDAT
jgi:4-hydroxy-3-polyprenylbenzoate decarboxylase